MQPSDKYFRICPANFSSDSCAASRTRQTTYSTSFKNNRAAETLLGLGTPRRTVEKQEQNRKKRARPKGMKQNCTA
jgi:hypothetical protein